MTQKAFFESLGAPLANARWSWGAVRPADGVVFLRVWRDNVQTHEGKQFVRILRGVSNRSRPHEHGRRERLKHVQNVQGGARCFLIMCQAEDTTARPRRIDDFEKKVLFTGGTVKPIGDDLWLELLSAVAVEDCTRRGAAAPRAEATISRT
jgi:hypothetical protein